VLLTARLYLCAGSAMRDDTAGTRVIPQA
jgi:hypothetical protein